MAASFTVHLQMLITSFYFATDFNDTGIKVVFRIHSYKYTMFRIAVPYKNHMYHVELTDIEVNDS